MGKRGIDFKESIRTKISVQDFSEMEKFKLTDEEIRSVYLNINDEEIDRLKFFLVEFAKMLYNNN